MSTADDRPRTIGYWVDAERPDLPDPGVFVDATWDVAERQAVAAYLRGGRAVEVGSGCSPCRICGTPNGFEEFTDGAYLWPEGLAHYVADHAVRLPDEVVQHALCSTNSVSTVEQLGVVDTTWWTTTMTSDDPA